MTRHIATAVFLSIAAAPAIADRVGSGHPYADELSELGKALEQAKEAYEKAQYKRVLEYAEKIIPRAQGLDVRRNDRPYVNRLIEATKFLRKKARKGHYIERYGKQYWHYRRGKVLQNGGQLERAYKHYEKVDIPMLGPASAVYAGGCLRALGHGRHALETWRSVAQEQAEAGLYRGEALLRLAELCLAGGSLDRAARHLSKFEGWYRAVQRGAGPTLDDFEKLARVVKDFDPGGNPLGHHYRRFVEPDAVVNRLTANWYARRLARRAELLIAFVKADRGKGEKAAARLRTLHENALALDESDGVRRLLRDAERGAFVVGEDAWRKLPADLRLGLFYYAAGRFREAKRRISRYEDARGRLARATAALARGLMAYHRHEPGKARKRLRPFFGRWSSVAIAPEAQLAWANLQAASGGAGSWRKAKKAYRRLRRGRLGARAQLAWALAAANRGRAARASTLAKRAATRAHAGDLKRAARTLRAVLERAPGRAPGELEKVEAHLVFPGSGEVPFDPLAPGAGDVVKYELEASARKDCKRITGLRYWGSAFEPGVPPGGESLTFYRLPALYRR